ncbi:histidine kinase [Microbacterium oryzae]|uniref:sensor histidine kinase n=1 Tax=Microbacterium oryzae TaxID=743009 RepID=UPI0025B201BB|nr:histidine kinase [Microbacterium oryzae]MDN3311311.1 histidine kinase [Microbacterium oryzae]
MSDADLALPRPPGRLRRWLDAHPRTVDLLLATACEAPFVVAIVALLAMGRLSRAETLLGLAALVAGGIAVGLRRRHPFTATLACALLVALPVRYSAGGAIDILVLLYSLALYGTAVSLWTGFAIASALAIGAGLLYGLSGQVTAASTLGVSTAVVYLVPVLIGLQIRGRRRYIEAIIDRARDLARERDQRAQLAVADERARIAREMHDIVSHSLTVMITLSEGAAAQAEAGRAGAPAAMRTVAETGRASLAEMRRLLGVLRSPDEAAAVAPLPSSDDLDALVERFRGAGLAVRLTRDGAPIADAALALTVFRIVQEGLTNVLRHAPGARRVEVVVGRADGRVVVEIANGPGTRPGSGPSGRGTGIIGLRERAALYAGTIEAGAAADGGWLLRAELREGQG